MTWMRKMPTYRKVSLMRFSMMAPMLLTISTRAFLNSTDLRLMNTALFSMVCSMPSIRGRLKSFNLSSSVVPRASSLPAASI